MLLLKPVPLMCILVPPARLPMLGFTDEISTGCPGAQGKVESRAAQTSISQRVPATMMVLRLRIPSSAPWAKGHSLDSQ